MNASVTHAHGAHVLIVAIAVLAGCDGRTSDIADAGVDADAAGDGSRGVDSGDRDGEVEGDEGAETLTPVYVTFYSHNEEGGYWENLVNDEASYLEYRADLVARVRLLREHGAVLNWETDHSVLRAMAAHESGTILEETGGKNVLRWIAEDMEMVVDPHGHLTTYNHADLAHMIGQLGVDPSGVVGGFALYRCGASDGEIAVLDWESVIELDADGIIRGRQYPDALWEPRVLAQPAMVGHALDELSSGVWRPGSGPDFLVDQPEGRLVTVGQGYPHDELNLGGHHSNADVLYSNAGYVRELTEMIGDGEVPSDRIYTASIHLRDQPSVDGVTSTLEGLRATLEVLDPLVSSGSVVYLDYEGVVDVWTERYGGEPNRLGIEQFSVHDELMANVEEECWSRGACDPECSAAEVCDAGRGLCVSDCRVVGCPDGASICDVDTGLCPRESVLEVEREELAVVNPASGEEWWAAVHFPADASESHRYPAVIAVPGGSGAGSELERVADPTHNPTLHAGRGWVVVVFDADGRGLTGGTEDFCGSVHQDGLRALIEAVAELDYVDPDRVGLSSSSFGVTMASGVLARYPELPVRFLVDFEGPANRNDTGHCDASDTGHITHDCGDDSWWSQREASTFISEVRVPYLRIQTERDHAQPDNAHALHMIANATSTAYGGSGRSPWTRVNDGAMNEPNVPYTASEPPAYYGEEEPFDLAAFWDELLR